MTEILVKWLNEEVGLSKKVDKTSFAQDFASGYYLGEILHKFQLQDDFKHFSTGQTSDAKLNNFTRLEPTLHLLDIPFDTNIAYDVMLQKHGVATRLLYQLFVSLQRKVKNNLTGAAMETMRAPAPVKLQNIESGLYRERLKTLIPRESDLTLDEVSAKFQAKQMENERKARMERYKEMEKYEEIKQQQRKDSLEKSRIARHKQTELLAKIQAATVHIPKPPPSRTLQALNQRREIKRRKEAMNTQEEIFKYEQGLKKLVAPTAVGKDGGDVQEDMTMDSDEYLYRIKTQLDEDRSAREERAKRRRKVMVDQMKAHEAQEETHRQEQIVQRLMRQSQQERRIAVQLMQVRKEKDTIIKNRIFREKQYEERRLKDFQDALDLEAQLSKLAKQEYEEETKKVQELHYQIMAERAQERYKRHYDLCHENVLFIVDFACKIAEYRELTEKKVPEKYIREWKKLILTGNPLYTVDKDAMQDHLVNQREDILDGQDMAEYKNMLGEWKLVPEMNVKSSPSNNNILGHVLHRMFNMVAPPPPESPTPKFPEFPVRAAILGKMFAGKSTVVRELSKNHRIEYLSVDSLLSHAIDAFHSVELKEVKPDTAESAPVAEDSSTSINIEPPTPAFLNGAEEQQHFDEGHKVSESNLSATVEQEKSDDGPMLSDRAMIGGKALEYLSVGKPVPDDLLVSVIVAEIKKIPDGTGWILDGFPTNVAQAKLLEKAITGNDVSDQAIPVKKKLSKRSSLIADPKPPAEAKISGGALDVVIVKDISDEIVLKRAFGRTYNREQDKMYHEEFNPAPAGSQTGMGKTEKVVPVKDAAFDQEQVQHRITGYHDNWPQLEKFYTQLSVVRHVDAEADPREVYTEVEKSLFDTLDKLRNKSSDTTVKEDEEDTDLIPPSASQISAPDSSRKGSATSKSSGSLSQSDSKKSKSPRVSARSKDKGSDKAKKEKSRSRSGSGKGSAKGKKKSRSPTPVPPPEPVQEEIVTVPPPKPGSKEWEYVNENLPIEVAQACVPLWDNVESTYTKTSKHIFRQIRSEREAIIRYIFTNRKDFQSFLRRPDQKQVFVSAWQKDFNEIADDIRGDEETKAELHQRLDDLRERLWNICDTRKEEAENEREGIMTQGWLEDHLGVLINEYLTLMQVEVDRFHDTCKVLKDYYVGMAGKIPVEDSASYHRLPMVELDVDDPDVSPANSSETVNSEGKPVSPQVSQSDNKKLDKKGSKEDQSEGEVGATKTKSRTKIPLIQRGAGFPSMIADEGGKGKKGGKAATVNESETTFTEGDLEEKTIVDAYNVALSIVTQLIQSDVDAKEHEEEEERRLKEEQEKAKAALAGPPKGGAPKKGGGKSAKGKKGKKSKSPTPTPPTPVEEESEEDKRIKEVKIKMKEEYFGALYHEEENVKITLEVIRFRAVKTLADLKEKADGTYAEMEQWLGARFLQEMAAIDKLSELARNNIENASKLKNEVRLDQDEFIVNAELRVVRTPTPPPRPKPVDVPMTDTFTVTQLASLHTQLLNVAPSGLIANKAFMELISDTAMLTLGDDALPELWLNVSYTQLTELCNMCSHESEYVDWRKFLLTAAQPWKPASIDELLAAFHNFSAIDIAGNGWITEEQYLEVETWLFKKEEDHRPASPEDPEDPYPFDRYANLHKFLFTLFCDSEQTPPRLDYINMLMYFAMDSEAITGITRALSVATGEKIPMMSLKPDTSQSTQSIKIDDSVDEVTLPTYAKKPSVQVDPSPQSLVSVQSLWSVLHHGSSRLGDSHRFSISEDPEDKYSMERLKTIYEDLDSYNHTPISIQLLLQHPIIQDAIITTKRYQLPDIKSIFIHQALQGLDGEDSNSVQTSI